MLRQDHDQLITVDISGYGEDGPFRDMKAYDLLIQCEAGLASITGTPDAPGRVGVSVADIYCGMNAHAAVLQAFYARARDGRGSGIQVSLFDGLADRMAVPLLQLDYTGKAPARLGLAHPSIAPYGEFILRGKRSVVIAVQNDREWRNFCALLGRAELIDDARFSDNVSRCQHRPQLDRIIEGAVRSRSGNASRLAEKGQHCLWLC
jgi:itaconate CoA-transferase